MNRVSLALVAFMVCSPAVAGVAQEQQAVPVVTSAVPIEKVRFAGSASAVQMRIEVRSAGGTVIYDSDWKDGNIVDWSPRDRSGQPLAYGVYRLVMRSKNLAGQTSETEAALHVDSGGMAVDDQPGASPKITLTAHDGETGELITTSGDLSFRFGDFLNRQDTEVMRLTAAGELNVSGLIRAKGVVFPDGTILTTANGLGTAGEVAGVIRTDPSAPASAPASAAAGGTKSRPGTALIHLPPPVGTDRPTSATPGQLVPRPNVAPAAQFVVGDTGVMVGTTNAAYNLDVTGHVNTGTEYEIGGVSFAHKVGATNMFFGTSSGNLTTTGTQNTGVGAGTLSAVTTGNGNVAAGYHALNIDDAGQFNVATGPFALFGNTGGSYNTASGNQALQSNTSGAENVGIGDSALVSNTTGSNNTALGNYALSSNTIGSNNIAIGAFAGGSILDVNSNNIDIGNAGATSDAAIIRIGLTQTKTFIAGIRGVTTVNGNALPVVIDSVGQLGTVSSSRRYKFDISDMGDATDLMRLRPVTFRYLAHGDNAPLQYGLIAEEVAEVYPELVTRNKDGEVDAVMYQFLAPMLLNEVQKQHRQIEKQQEAIDRLMQRVEELERK